MMTENKSLTHLFRETFSFRTENDLPGSWYVERNSELKEPAIRCGKNSIEFLSAGNKFLPVIPDTDDCAVRFSAKMDFETAKSIGFTLYFHYDTFTGRGKAVQFTMKDGENAFVRFGKTALNYFYPEQEKSFALDRSVFLQEFSCGMLVKEGVLTFEIGSEKICFEAGRGSGKVAFSREHFFDVLFMTAFELDGNVPGKSLSRKSFTVPLPDTFTHFPIFCDVTLLDYGNCMDAKLSFRGGCAESLLGEGGYHGMNADILERPYLKVLNDNEIQKFILHDKTMVLAPSNHINRFLYTLLYDKPQWPFERTIRFMKQSDEFDLAVGFDEYYHNAAPDREMTPAETLFDREGTVLDCGSGVTGNGKKRIDFLSQSDKEIIGKLPVSDPRYDKAVQYAKNNHFFFEKEEAHFSITVFADSEVPLDYEVTLEDAFLRKVRTLSFQQTSSVEQLHTVRFNKVLLEVETLQDLACGVWHLRVRSKDPSVAPLEDYCSFEVMSREKDAPCPPLLSGLPFLYNARTETRGLLSDSFDPWLGGKSINESHYVSCAVMLPESFRKYKMAPTLHAYNRKNFSWISARTLNNPKIEDNLDVIAESDYVNVWDNYRRYSLLYWYAYLGEKLTWLIDFLKSVGDTEFDLEKYERMSHNEVEALPRKELLRFMELYWEPWVDYVNERTRKLQADTLKELRKINPKLEFAQYGPFHIYAGRLKGPESLRLLGNESITPDLTAFWQFEDYPFSCGYGLERGLYCLTACLLALPGSRIYPEIYTGSKLMGGCPDGAVFYAHPPFGGGIPKTSERKRKDRSEKTLLRQLANWVYASGYLTRDGFRFWTERGLQSMRFTRKWFEVLLRFWPNVLDHEPARPVRSAAFISSIASRKGNQRLIINTDHSIPDVHETSTEDVPAIYEDALQCGLCAGFQMWDTDLDQLSPDQVDTLVLPPLRGMAPETLARIRFLHENGVNLVVCENVDGLEDLFGVEDTGVMTGVSLVTAVGDLCRGKSEFCDEGDLCCGSYKAVDCEVLLSAEIPVLTLKKNAKASAAFFNVPPHHVKSERLHQRLSYGKGSISEFMREAIGTLMKSFSKSGISITDGRLIACHTADQGIMVLVSNPDEDHAMTARITLEKGCGYDGEPICNFPVVFIEEDAEKRIGRFTLPPGEVLTMFFPGT